MQFVTLKHPFSCTGSSQDEMFGQMFSEFIKVFFGEQFSERTTISKWYKKKLKKKLADSHLKMQATVKIEPFTAITPESISKPKSLKNKTKQKHQDLFHGSIKSIIHQHLIIKKHYGMLGTHLLFIGQVSAKVSI